MTVSSSQLHGYWELTEPRLAFDPTDTTQVALNPLAGLRDFGPFTSAVRKGVRGPGPLKPIQQANTWNVQTWEID